MHFTLYSDMKFQISRLALAATGLAVIVSFSACKSNESVYKKAYEKAQASTQTTTTTAVEPTTTTTTTTTTEQVPVKVTPVQSASSSTSTSEVTVRTEKVSVVNGGGLKDYSVVCGSFSLLANAEGLQKTLKSKGYDAQIALNSETKLYRVVAATFEQKSDAIASRDRLRDTYPDAWLLYDKK